MKRLMVVIKMTSKCDKCKNTLSTRFNSLGPNKGKFSLHCSICKSEFIQEIKNEPDIPEIIRSVEEIQPDDIYIKVQMPEIIKHFIECGWGACYNTLFDRVIKKYLDDEKVLDFILRDNIIRDFPQRNIVGVTGAKIYPELLNRLKEVESKKIKEYLQNEFPN